MTPPAIGLSFNNFDLLTASNSLVQQRTSNPANEITGIAATVGTQWATPVYDRNGNMTSVPQPTDLTALATATWDAWNRLVTYTDSSDNYHNNFYDGINRRVMHVEADEQRAYVYSDQWQVLEERVNPYLSPDRQFVWGIRYIDDCVSATAASPARWTSGCTPCKTPIGTSWRSTILPHRPSPERYAYTPYGVVLFLNGSFEPLSGNNSAYDWETLYCGYRYDAAVGLYLVRHRWLNQPLGCWLSRDLMPHTIGAENGYGECSPPNLVDAFGTTCECSFPGQKLLFSEIDLAGQKVLTCEDWCGILLARALTGLSLWVATCIMACAKLCDGVPPWWCFAPCSLFCMLSGGAGAVGAIKQYEDCMKDCKKKPPPPTPTPVPKPPPGPIAINQPCGN